MASDLPAGSGTRRRLTALVGLALSGALAAGAVAGWLVWRAPDTVRLTGSRATSDPVARATVPPGVPAPRATTVPPASTAPAPDPVQITAVAPPIRISIPSQGIAAPVVPEGTDPQGSLVIPPPAQVGWYDAGPMPGEPGSTLLAGHIDDYGVPGAFLHLNAVPVGAQVSLATADGRTLDYTVTDRRSIPQSALATSGLLTRTGPPRLVLVTCGGAYDSHAHLYLDNIVLVASPTPSPGPAK